jgi:hypothetical protein
MGGRSSRTYSLGESRHEREGDSPVGDTGCKLPLFRGLEESAHEERKTVDDGYSGLSLLDSDLAAKTSMVMKSIERVPKKREKKIGRR